MSSKTGETFSQSAILHSSEKLFVHHEILSPGSRASSPHSHSVNEEMVFVLEGFPTLHLGNQATELKPGDFMSFEPGSELHFIENRTENSVRILVISSNDPTDSIAYS